MGRKVAALKIRDPELYRLMKNFLTTYLPDTKQKSAHTIQAYRDALNLYMGFLDSAKSIKLKEVRISDFNLRTCLLFSDGCMKSVAMKAPQSTKGFRI